MNIALAIMHLYPQAVPLVDFVVQDDSDGEGPYIAAWNLEDDQPTEEELAAAWDEMQPSETQLLEESRVAKLSELSAACNSAILAGFTSNALEEDNTYDFGYDDQINLGGMLNAITAGLAPESIIWKASGLPKLHTTEQFKQVFVDGLNHKNACIGRYWTLKAEALAALSIEDVETIVW